MAWQSVSRVQIFTDSQYVKDNLFRARRVEEERLEEIDTGNLEKIGPVESNSRQPREGWNHSAL